MTILTLLIPLAIIIAVVAVGAFFWAVRSGQFDDLEAEGLRIVLDDDTAPPPPDKESR